LPSPSTQFCRRPFSLFFLILCEGLGFPLREWTFFLSSTCCSSDCFFAFRSGGVPPRDHGPRQERETPRSAASEACALRSLLVVASLFPSELTWKATFISSVHFPFHPVSDLPLFSRNFVREVPHFSPFFFPFNESGDFRVPPFHVTWRKSRSWTGNWNPRFPWSPFSALSSPEGTHSKN